jgi:hypothetical protein
VVILFHWSHRRSKCISYRWAYKPFRTELVDCDTNNDGCDGGCMDYAFECVINNDGIDTEVYYVFLIIFLCTFCFNVKKIQRDNFI